MAASLLLTAVSREAGPTALWRLVFWTATGTGCLAATATSEAVVWESRLAAAAWSLNKLLAALLLPHGLPQHLKRLPGNGAALLHHTSKLISVSGLHIKKCFVKKKHFGAKLNLLHRLRRNTRCLNIPPKQGLINT